MAGRRVFLALWPDETVRNELSRLATILQKSGEIQATPVTKENLHLTLLFLGKLDDEFLSKLVTALDNVAFEPFVLDINRWGHFSKPEILWVGADNHPDNLEILYKQIRTIVTRSLHGIKSKRFRPHISLFRNVYRLPQVYDFDDIVWEVDSFVLVESKLLPEGAKYSVIHQWDADTY